MTGAETEIRELIEGWAKAVRDRDIDGTTLLRCGTTKELAKDPDTRLRLTVGLRKEHGRWTIAHEHHSFPAK